MHKYTENGAENQGMEALPPQRRRKKKNWCVRNFVCCCWCFNRIEKEKIYLAEGGEDPEPSGILTPN